MIVKMESILQFCPQCHVLLNNTNKRLVQDSCGHSKCRQCLLDDDLACRACLETHQKLREEEWKEEQMRQEIKKAKSMMEKRKEERREQRRPGRKRNVIGKRNETSNEKRNEPPRAGIEIKKEEPTLTQNIEQNGNDTGRVLRNSKMSIESMKNMSVGNVIGDVSIEKVEDKTNRKSVCRNDNNKVGSKRKQVVKKKTDDKSKNKNIEKVDNKIGKRRSGRRRGEVTIEKIKTCDEIIREVKRNAEKLKAESDCNHPNNETIKENNKQELLTNQCVAGESVIKTEVNNEDNQRETTLKDQTHKRGETPGVIRYEERPRRSLKLGLTSEKPKPKRRYQSLVIPSHIIVITKIPSQYRCTVCNRTFRSSGNIKYHQLCGRGEKPLKCKECGKGFVTPSSFEIHMRSHTGERPFTCDICGRSFAQKSKLDRHSAIHTERKLHVCTTCGKKLTSAEGLKRHLLQHTGERPFRCKLCPRSFSNASNLNKHQSVHAKDKLFMCDRCGKKFAGKWSLVVHKKIHTGKKPYSCDKCQRTFISAQDLSRHNDIHLDVKKFTCGICSTKFRRKDNMNRHMKNTHTMLEIEKYKKSKTVIKSDIPIIKTPDIQLKPPDPIIQDNPNAINVIKTSGKTDNPPPSPNKPTYTNAVPVINAPIKLAFKKDAFKSNYNINKRDFDDLPRIEIPKTYNMQESLNICQRILSPMNTSVNDNRNDVIKTIETIPKNVITSVGKVNEKDSLEICKRILHPIDPSSIHYETSFENKQHASIKNMKYKINLSTYENMSGKNNVQKVTEVPDVIEAPREYTELQPVRLYPDDFNKGTEHQSVIVNLQNNDLGRDRIPPFNEMHWRKRTQYNNMK